MLAYQTITLILQVPYLTLAKLDPPCASAQPTLEADEAKAPKSTGSKESASGEEFEPDQAVKIIPVVPAVMPPVIAAPSLTLSRSSSEPVMQLMQVSFGLHGTPGHAIGIFCPMAHQDGSLMLVQGSACLLFIAAVSSLFPMCFLRSRCSPD